MLLPTRTSALRCTHPTPAPRLLASSPLPLTPLGPVFYSPLRCIERRPARLQLLEIGKRLQQVRCTDLPVTSVQTERASRQTLSQQLTLMPPLPSATAKTLASSSPHSSTAQPGLSRDRRVPYLQLPLFKTCKGFDKIKRFAWGCTHTVNV